MTISLPFMRPNTVIPFDYFNKINEKTHGKLNEIINFFNGRINQTEFVPLEGRYFFPQLKIKLQERKNQLYNDKIEKCNESFKKALTTHSGCENANEVFNKLCHLFKEPIDQKLCFEQRVDSDKAVCKDFLQNYLPSKECLESEAAYNELAKIFEFEGACVINEGIVNAEFNTDSIIYKLYKKTDSLLEGQTTTTQEVRCDFGDKPLSCQEGALQQVRERFKLFGYVEYTRPELIKISALFLAAGLFSLSAFACYRDSKKDHLSEKQITELKKNSIEFGFMGLVCLVAGGCFTAYPAL